MRKYLLFCLLFALKLQVNAQSPNFQWAKNMGGYNGAPTGLSVVTDASGNVYSTGYFEGRVDFDPGPNTFYLTSAGSNDIFICKLNASGNFLWAKQLGGTSSDQGNSIFLNAAGSIFVTGSFSGTADFDPGAAIYNLTSAGGTDIFIFRLDASGNFTWARGMGYTWDDHGNSIALDAADNVYTTGDFQGNVDFDPGAGSYNLNTGGNFPNIFISKLNSIGNFVWAKQMQGGSAFGRSITLDISGSIYTTGEFNSTVDFDPGAGINNLASAGAQDIFISKLNASGSFLWAKQLGGTQFDQGFSIKTDALGNVYTTGSFYGTADFDPGPAIFNLTSVGYYDVFISKLDASGNFLLASGVGGSNGSDYGRSISLDGSGNIYVAGQFNGTVDFDPGASIFNLTGPGASEIFVLKLNTSGNFVWAKQMGGTSNDFVNSITLDATGNVYTTGTFSEIVDFDPGAGSNNLIAVGGGLMYISKLDNSGNFVWAKSSGARVSTVAVSIITDLAGNVYTAGNFLGTVDFDPGPGIVNLSTALTDLGGDVFVTKCNSTGNLIWAKQFGGASLDYASSIAVDASGNVYTAGNFKGTVDFDPGAAIFNLTASSSNSDIFVCKLNASGNFVWASKIGTTTVENAYSIAIDPSGNIFTAGYYFPGTNSYQVYINKLDPSGNLLWSKIYGGTGSDRAQAITTDGSGNIYFTGYFTGTADLDPGVGIFNLTAPGTGYEAFISKLDGSGNFIWAKQLGGTGSDEGSAIDVDASGKVYVAGKFYLTADFDPGPGAFNMTSAGLADIFISKLDNSGNFIWAKQIGNTNGDDVRSIVVDNSGNVYTTGEFAGTLDFDPGAGTFNLNASPIADVYISKLDNLGNFVWAQMYGGTQIGTQTIHVNSMALDGSDNIYTCGVFYETADFDPGPGIASLTAIGHPDLFIHKLSQCTPPLAVITPSGPISFCSGGSVNLNANVGAGLTYQWSKNGAPISGATSSNYIATTTGSYTVVESTSASCTGNPSAAVQVTVSTTVPATPGSITTTGGAVKVCPGDIRIYSVVAVAGATYTWTPCAGSTITSGQNTNSVTIQYNAGFPASDSLRVVATNSCGNSAQRKLKITRNTPGTPSSIIGDTYGVCNLSGKPYSVTSVAGMTYAWSFNTGTATVASGQGTSAITANFGAGFISGSLSVTATNGCGTSAVRVKSIYAKPATPVSITGSVGVCLNQQDVPYSITPLANVTNYTWTGPTGSHISDGVTTSAGTTLITTAAAVTVDFATTAGSVKVRGNNLCASGSYKSLAVAIVCREGNFSNENLNTHLYPNPASTDFTVENDDSSVPFNVEVYDTYGRLVFSEVNLSSGYNVSTNGWASGLYSVFIRNGNNQDVLKLVLQK